MRGVSRRRISERKTWYSSVYQKSDFPEDTREEWIRISLYVKGTDNFRCRACYKKFYRKSKELTVHHIIPRDCGGTNDFDNLISLCLECHDMIEEYGYRTRVEIEGCNKKYRPAKEEPITTKAKDDMLEKIDSSRPAWHASVYGGGRSFTDARFIKK